MKNNMDKLDAVMTSLHYLESEVSKAGLNDISGILKGTISDIEGISTGSRCGSNLHRAIKISGILERATSHIEGINTGSCCGPNLHEIIISFYTIYWNCLTDYLKIMGTLPDHILR